jgi:deoxycytidylate deaminase
MTITKRNVRYFNMAKNMSKLSDFQTHHIGCIVVYGKHILSTGFNMSKTHPIQCEYNKYRNINAGEMTAHKLHAEICALSKIQNMEIDWRKVEIYIYREKKSGQLALAKPCKACNRYIKDLKIKHVFYTGDDSYVYENFVLN